MGSGGQRSVKRRATGGTVASAKAQASTGGSMHWRHLAKLM